jgi:hypothetical protein
VDFYNPEKEEQRPAGFRAKEAKITAQPLRLKALFHF